MKQEQKESIEHLMYHMQKNNYKEICDKIKVAIFDSLINLSEHNGNIITTKELEYMRNNLEKMRTKDKEAETTAIVNVIDNLISRGIKN